MDRTVQQDRLLESKMDGFKLGERGSREFLESLLPMLEVALEYTSLKQPMSWEPKLFDNEAWRTGTRENRLRISVTANCLEKAMESIEREISRLEK
jgi:hypothetical protein